ncbi:hypothetical protein [Nitratireductor thuwali]|uniref:Flagellar assembly protein FliH/Type III secretion system HrpE domain-containing protein n=1 Tax=Nitratireductor thuwali TaxID=2267699 RepID=A0ABY5MFL1_9HYPH|nr:hypothetical protein NTH_01266 [Nitratireductor thuwali]
MSAIALADALTDFGSGQVLPQRRKADFTAAGTAVQQPAASVPEPKPTESRKELEAGIAEAEAKAEERVRLEYEALLAGERDKHEAETQLLKAQLGEEAAVLIGARFEALEQQVVSLTSSVAARILGVALTEDLQRRSIDELARIVSQALADSEAVNVRVRGTPLMCEALRGKIGDNANRVTFADGPDMDLTVQLDETLLETRLAEWSNALAEVFE